MSTVYQPLIPTGTVNLDEDYENIQGNFQQLDTTYGTDHVAYSQATNNGYHNILHLIPHAPPAFTNGIGQFFSQTVSDGYDTDQALYYISGTTPGKLIQLTSNLVPSLNTNGYTFLAGGLIMQWGVVNAPGSSGTVTFATANKAFSSACYNVQLTVRRDGSSSTQGMYINGLPTATGFAYNGSSAPTSLYWVALGK